MNRSAAQAKTSAGVRVALLLALLATLGAAPAMVWMHGTTVHADKRVRPERVAEGKVESTAGTPVNGAVVYLKDTETLAVKSFICGADGSFRFGQLSRSDDYTIWAQAGDKKSKVQALSSFDDKNDFYFTFTLG